jgi:phosphoribosyl 1,2-cyclic phosphodiesterase
VALRDAADHLVVLDAGTGIRPLGLALNAGPVDGGRVDVLLTHTHWDHIQGLPFFLPLHRAGSDVRIYGAAQSGVPLEQILGRQMDPVVFPVPLKALAATVTVHEITEQTFELPGFTVRAHRLRHPGTTLGFRLTPAGGGGPSVAYVTDNELGPGGNYDVPASWRSSLEGFLSGVDMLIHDAMYAPTQIGARAGWGHSSVDEVVALAGACGTRQLVLFHHEPANDDDAVDALVADARRMAARYPGLDVSAAREGMTLVLE